MRQEDSTGPGKDLCKFSMKWRGIIVRISKVLSTNCCLVFGGSLFFESFLKNQRLIYIIINFSGTFREVFLEDSNIIYGVQQTLPKNNMATP